MINLRHDDLILLASTLTIGMFATGLKDNETDPARIDMLEEIIKQSGHIIRERYEMYGRPYGKDGLERWVEELHAVLSEAVGERDNENTH